MKKLICVTVVLVMFLLTILSLAASDKPKNIMLLFDLKDYNKEIDSTIDLFFKKILGPRDHLIIMTPANKIYSYSSKILSESGPKIIQEVKNNVKKHASVLGADYRNIYTQMLNTVNEIRENRGSQDVKNLIAAYENNRKELIRTRRVNEQLLLEFSDVFARSKKITGDTENQIYLFFQKEYRPIPDGDTMNILRENMEISFQAVEVFLAERSKMDFASDQVAEELRNGGVIFNFIYISPKEIPTGRYQLIDNSGDFYSAMSKIVDMTGGKIITTAQPKAIFEDM